jgi:hypothetical protein
MVKRIEKKNNKTLKQTEKAEEQVEKDISIDSDEELKQLDAKTKGNTRNAQVNRNIEALKNIDMVIYKFNPRISELCM